MTEVFIVFSKHSMGDDKDFTVFTSALAARTECAKRNEAYCDDRRDIRWVMAKDSPCGDYGENVGPTEGPWAYDVFEVKE